ncbi:MAG: T9SS type A sorting domain-containing protein [Saprospiraceae bacterium]|nr:T9SS type A sorting domain-containing protein [Saprospiraceae bacterium]
MKKNNPNHLLITYSNYGLPDNVLETKDGGATWINVEGNLPDVPVRSVLFSPENNTQAVIATEIGVWFTEKLDGSNTVWIPPAIGRGTPLVRTDMLQLRESDGIILAATHGRGMFTSDVFSKAKIALDAPQIGYLNAPVQFLGSVSLGGENYNWTFGDGEGSDQEDPTHQYRQIGTYEVIFTLNDSLTTRSKIKILPDKALPYAKGKAGYSGDFEVNPQDYGVHTISGSSFELGKSNINGKNGTFSGNNAFVLGINEQFYQKNTHTMFYLPNFDFSERGIYEFSFWSKYFVQNGFDGFLVEYSINKGQSWNILGAEQPNWYDFTNSNNLEGAAFPNGTPYFGRSRSEFTPFFLDVSFLGGNKDVAFRFVFRSNDVGNHPGVVIDDVEIKKYEGELATQIVSLTADYTSSEEITVEWVTQPEYFATRFVVERSLNGRDYEEVAKVEALGKLTSRVQSYEQATLGIRNLYFYRIRSLNENRSEAYSYEFTTPPVVVRRELEDVEVYSTFPNPFNDYLDFTFTDFVNEPVTFELYDVAGRLILKRQQEVNNVYVRIETGVLPQGTYLLNYKIGERTAKTMKLLKM